VGWGILYAGGFAFDAEGYEQPPASLTKREVDPLMRPRQIRYSNEAWLFEPGEMRFVRLPDAPVAAFWPEEESADDLVKAVRAWRNEPGCAA